METVRKLWNSEESNITNTKKVLSLVIIPLWFKSPVETRRNSEKRTIVTGKQAKTLYSKVILINSEKAKHRTVQKTVSSKHEYSVNRTNGKQ